MGWAGVSRGAPRRFVGDDNDIFSPHIDVDRRAAWLLRISRIASPWGARPATSFIRRLRDVGHPEVHASRVTSWEGGSAPVNIALIASYERALEMRAGRLQGPVVAMLLATDPRAPLTSVPALSRTDLFALQSEICDRVDAGQASGGDWITLAGLLTTPGAIPPPRSIIERWTHQLLQEFVRSVHDDYTSRWGAISAMLADPLLAPIVRDQAHQVAAEPGVPFARLIWDVLSQDVDPTVTESYMSGLLSHDQERQMGVSFGVATMLTRRQLSHADIRKLIEIVRRMAVASPEQRELALMFAARLGGTVPSLVGMPMRVTEVGLRHSLAKPPYLANFVRRVREDSGLHDDPMIVRLLQEALSHHFLDKRQMACQLMAASPYADSVATQAVQIAAEAPRAEDRLTAVLLLRQIAPADTSIMYGLLESPDPVVVNHAMVAIVRAGGRVPPHRERLFADALTREGAVLAATMTGRMIPDATPGELASQRWWAEHGGFITSPTESVADRAGPEAG